MVVYWSFWRAWSVSKVHKVVFSKYWTDQTDFRKLASAAQDTDGFLWLSWRVGCLTGLGSKEVGNQAKDNPCHVPQVTAEWYLWCGRAHEPAGSQDGSYMWSRIKDLVAIILFWALEVSVLIMFFSAEKFDFFSSVMSTFTRTLSGQEQNQRGSNLPNCVPGLAPHWLLIKNDYFWIFLDLGVGCPAHHCTVAVHYSNCSRANWKSCKSACLVIAIIWKHPKVCATLSELVTIQFIDNLNFIV